VNRWSRFVISGAVVAATVAVGGAVSSASSFPSLAAQAPIPVTPTSMADRPESNYVSVPDCRLVDTRKARGKIKKISPRSFQIVGNGNLASQGGSKVGCDVPVGANAISAHFTSFNASKSGKFSAYPSGTSSGLPVLFFTKHRTTTAGATQEITVGSGKGLTVSSTGKANLTLDVNGYYLPRIAASVSSNGVLGNHTEQVLSAARGSGNPTGVYVVALNQDTTGCLVQATPQTTGFVLVTAVLNNSTATVVGRAPATGNLADTPFAMTITC
jgi:hypothetical protein